MEEKKKIKSIMNDIIKGIKFSLVFGLIIGFIIGIVKGISLAYSQGYLQNSLYTLALDAMQPTLNSVILKSVILAIVAVLFITIPVSIIRTYKKSGLALISSFIILLYIASFRRISPFNYFLFILILFGVVYSICISVRFREKFSFLNKVANGKLVLVPIILILICNGFIYSYRLINRSKGPNIILISIDALRADHLSCYGYHRNTSPNIDQLARGGVLFKNCLSQATWTLPSHASIFLSQYVWRHKVDNRNKRLVNSFATLAETLRDRNYTTCAFVGGGLLSAKFGFFNQGFEIYDDGIPHRREHYEISSYINKLLSWLESVRNRKFFLFIHTYDVHEPYNPPAPYFDLYTKGRCKGELDYIMAVYDGGINYVDDQLGKIFEKLNQLGIDNNTIIILTADHGEAFREHDRLGHGHKPYIEIVHVPLIMKGPGIPRNRIYETWVQHIDILPTILEILNIPQRKEMQGRSILPLMKIYEIEEDFKTYSFGLVRNIPQRRFSMSLRTKEWTYIMNQDGLDELYDRINDPKEQNDIIKKRPLIAQKLKKELEDFIALTSEAKPQIAEKVRIDEELKEQLKSLGYLH
ncbi:2,3-bisphosphoglycerate-independent phosphoglycerate mutase [subsurface metagenome]